MLKFSNNDWGDIDSPWIGVPMKTWLPITCHYTPSEYKAKNIIYFQGDPFDYAYIVAAGRVRISIYNEDAEKHLYVADLGAMFGEIDCILSTARVATATAITDCMLYVIPSQELQALFHQHPELSEAMLQYQARKSHLMISQNASMAFDTAECRIAKTLIQLNAEYGKRVEPDSTRINIKFTCNDIAGLVNVTRVTANNILLDFTHEGIIKKKDSYYSILNLKALETIAASII